MIRLFILVVILVVIVSRVLHISAGWAWIIVLVAIAGLVVFGGHRAKFRYVTPSAMWKCPYCFKRTKLGASACHHCGRGLMVAMVPPSPLPPEPTDAAGYLVAGQPEAAFEFVKADADIAMARGDEGTAATALVLTDRIVQEALSSETVRKAGVLAAKLRRWQRRVKETGAASPGTAAARLATLNKLRDDQLISAEEYESKRAALIAGI